ncbi:MAG: AraC family transcriptional regulator [Cyclobacteriaceae bacterium]
MHYQKIYPSERLAPFIKCYYHWEDAGNLLPLVVQSPPSGYEAMVFNYVDPYFVSKGPEGKKNVPASFYAGQHTSNYDLHLCGSIGMFGVVFRPAAFATLFRVSVKDTADQQIPLDEILGLEGRQLTQRILEAGSTGERVEVMNRFLLQKVWLASLHFSVAHRAAMLIDDRNGLISIQNLIGETGCCHRSLQRNFIEIVGVSPKFYTRIRRFSFISYRLMYHKDDWHELIYRGGYCDQSHLIKDFQFFNRENPSAYLLQHNELIRYLEK